jgi:putative protease
MADYNKVGLFNMRGGRVLLCRKRHSTSLLILPGGCIEAGESAIQCLERELREELGDVTVSGLEYIGTYTDQAAGDATKTVQVELYRGELAGTPEPHSEIAELVWFGERDDRARLAPSLVNRILPDLVTRGLLPWDTAPAVELLAPARDLECGLAAIDCGADAVYIGAPRFGAREAAGNSLETVAALVRHAHKYWARVYATLNTLLGDDELPLARTLAWQLHDAGVDGLIIQDTGLLELDLPPLALIASTQMHNHTPERVAFLERVGFRRAILARELDLDQIRAIRRAAPRIELECFVHGALCVCYSGQCYLSYALGGRSANRGQCAQPCRKSYTLVDAEGRVLELGRHLLSLRDLNLSEHLPELLEAGVTSFKIEGRLKDRSYVANVVAYYRSRMDDALSAAGARRASSGASSAGFRPDPAKTFNRGFTAYFLHGRAEPVGSPETPKMVGEEVGRVISTGPRDFTIEASLALHAGDGLCFFDRDGQLRGTTVNGVRGSTVEPDKIEGIEPGTLISRNHDHQFLTQVAKSRPKRRIAVKLTLGERALTVVDEDGNRAEVALACDLEPARQPEPARAAIVRQFGRTGDTEFVCAGVSVERETVPFLPVSTLNALRRDALDLLRAVRETNRPRLEGGIVPNATPFPEKELSYLGNVLNRQAEAFYRRHGVMRIEPAAESGLDMDDRKVMTTRYCLKHQLGLCPRDAATAQPAEPLALIDDEGHRLELCFDCRECEMEVWLGSAIAAPGTSRRE